MAENDCIEGPFIAYYRVSTKAQGKSGNGLEAQRRDIDLFLSAYACQGASVVAEYTDVASGKHDDPRRRPGLSDALAHCRRTGAVLLVSKLDRLSRKVLHIAQLMDDKTVKFKVVSMPHADEFQLQLYASLAEQERRFISLRTKAGLASVKAKGRPWAGTVAVPLTRPLPIAVSPITMPRISPRSPCRCVLLSHHIKPLQTPSQRQVSRRQEARRSGIHRL